MNFSVREPINAYTHLFGAVLSFIGTIILFIYGYHVSELTPLSIISIITFGLSLIALYTSSGLYHAIYTSDEVLLKFKKLDHSMIFLLISGSYTPFCLLALTGMWRLTIFTLIWSLAITGIVLKIFWINMPRWISTGFYIGMGWVAILALNPLLKSLNTGGVIWLTLGGVMYTIGGIIYGIKKPNISTRFGFHELFHIFVLLGSMCHYWCILNYVL